MSALESDFQKKASPQQFNGFEASLRFRHVLTYRLKHTMRQKTPSKKKLAASVLKPILS
jgi:hypothetical protein